uniref:NADH-ubiquinone oxidoreductase chain 4 n=1 Tax=Euborellia annulipes TaxID=146833 RepID=A0A343YVG2_9NEOP|nr:NADH dehydrogenase subunit 4 [Euborellia annulipes]
MLKLIMGSLFILVLGGLNFWWVVSLWLGLISFLMVFFTPLFSLSSEVSMGLGIDILSHTLTWLSIWIVMLMIIASSSIKVHKIFSNYFLLTILLLMLFLISSFVTMDMLIFYISFEASLIPTLMLITGWGVQPERLQAGTYMMIYTLLASLPLLIGIFYLSNLSDSMKFFSIWKMNQINNSFIYISLVMAFLVKSPMFLAHLWLPKAHVEAPVSGSMILAGVLLKLGGYGLIRLLRAVVYLNLKLSYLWISISLIGGLVISLICLRQSDLKMLVAYSSVAHMSLGIAGIFTMTNWGIMGGLVLMLGHGLCSSCLFALVNLVYERSGSRSLFLNRGLLNLMPSMSLWWFLLSACNMAAPPSLNLLGEISLLTSVMNWSSSSVYLLMLTLFFGAMYCYYLYSYSQHGLIYTGIYLCHPGEIREFLLMMLHWLPLNFLILKSNLFLMSF